MKNRKKQDASAAQSPDSTQFEARWAVIRDKILANADHLIDRGTIRPKKARKQTHFVLRFEDILADGRQVDRSIYLGHDPEIVSRSRKLLTKLRWRGQWTDEAAAFERFASTMRSNMRRLSEGLPRKLSRALL